MPGRLRVGFGMSWPFSDSLLGYSLRNCKILTLQKAWPKYKLGGSQKMVSEWHNSFCQKQRKDSEFPYVHSFKALSPNPDLRDSCHVCLSVVSLSPVPLCFFPSDFQMTPTRPFISTWSLGKDSEIPFGPGLSPIFKNLRDQIHPFQSILVHWFLNVDIHSCHLLFAYFQFTLIHVLNIPGSYAVLSFAAPGFTSISSHIHNWALFSLWLHAFILSGIISPLFSSSIWAPTDLRSSSFSVISFGQFILFMRSQGKNTEVVCHSLLHWTTFCQNSPPWPTHLGWPYLAWLIVSLSKKRLWSMCLLGSNICWIIKKAREFQKNIYFCFTDYAKSFDSVDHNKLWKIPQEMGIPDHLTCFLRNLYPGQEATIRTRHGITGWFQIGKEVHQGCILPPCLFNLHAEYIKQNAGWMKHKQESRLPGEIAITQICRWHHPYGRKWRGTKEPLDEGERGEWNS